MATIVTFASGKGGVGKSVVVSNLGLALALRGRRVVLADLDVGGSNLATLFGTFEAGPDLDAFFTRQIDSLEQARRPLRRDLSLIVGAGETLATANPNWAMKQRLLRHLRRLDADVVLVDVGAGAGNHALDFFNAGDLRVLVTLPEPTASVDAYRFVKLATIRASASQISTRNPERRGVERRDFRRAEDLWRSLGETGEHAPAAAVPAPWVVMNQATPESRHFERLKLVTRRFLDHDLELLGVIPRDEAIGESVATFLPVVESAPGSPSADAFDGLAQRLDDELTRHALARRSDTSELPELGDLVASVPSAPR